MKKARSKKAEPKKFDHKKVAEQKTETKRLERKRLEAKKSDAKKTAPKKPGRKTGAPKKLAAPKPVESPKPVERLSEAPAILPRIIASLEDDKAEQIVSIDLSGRSSLCDAVVIASGRSSRHVASIAEHLARRLKEAGYGTRPVNGAAQGDWVLVDAGDVIVHVFRPEVRTYYDLEGMWSVQEPQPKPKPKAKRTRIHAA